MFAYTRSLLAERKKQLRALERTPSERADYLSCLRSLEEAVAELETLLRQDGDEAGTIEERCQRRM